MRRTERVVDIDFRQRGKRLGEIGVVLGLARLEADVLEQEQLAGFSAAALAFASSPTTSLAIATGLPSSSLRRAATGARENSGFTSPFGRPRWEQRMTAALWSSRYLMVGRAATMRLSEVMTPSFSGTLKSQRTEYLFAVYVDVLHRLFVVEVIEIATLHFM